jgi:hypothetical protein
MSPVHCGAERGAQPLDLSLRLLKL